MTTKISIFLSSPNFFDETGEFEFLNIDYFVPASDCTFKMTPKNANEQIFMMFNPYVFMVQSDPNGSLITG